MMCAKAGAVTHWSSEFLPTNERLNPVSNFFSEASGISESEFHRVLDLFEQAYAPVIAAKGGRLVVDRLWRNDQVNSRAYLSGDEWHVEMWGGFAREPAMTFDGFVLAACHELGHLLGGAPLLKGNFSNDGQADYFASLQCFKKVFGAHDNVADVHGKVVDPLAELRCRKVYASANDQALCERGTLAALSLSSLIASLERSSTPSLGTPDPRIVSQTNQGHPSAQCRLDTYFAGLLCPLSPDAELSGVDYRVGTCHESSGHEYGRRPDCWFAPGQ